MRQIKKSKILKMIWIGSMFGILVTGSVIMFGPNGQTQKPGVALSAPSSDLPDYLLPDEVNTIKSFRQVAPSVVFVHNLKTYMNLFSFDVSQVQKGVGSGFIWDRSGHVVTNFHVIAGASNIAVTLQDGKIYKAKLIGAEPRKDTAVLQIKAQALPEMSFAQRVADSSKLLVGQKTIAIGNPFGLDHSTTTGVISALGREVPAMLGGVSIRDVIQTDASINPGNSGGPLLDSRGFLIGMNTAIFSESGGSAGIGFAVPSNTIQRVVTQIIKYGKVSQAGIGVIPLVDKIASDLGVKGVIIGRVLEDSPAEKVGLTGTYRDQTETHLGDIIVAVDGKEISNYDDLYNSLDGKQAGDEVTLTYLRKKRTREVKIKLIDVSN